MGVDYYVDVICGIKVNIKDLKRVISPAIWEEQPRYDTRTGKVTHMEKVLVKKEKFEYVFGPFSDTDDDSLFCKIVKTLSLDYAYNDESTEVIIGKKIFTDEELGNLNCPEGQISLQELTEVFEKMKSVFPDNEINLHSVGHVSY